MSDEKTSSVFAHLERSNSGARGGAGGRHYACLLNTDPSQRRDSEPMAITLFDGPDHMPVDSIGHGVLEVMALCGARVFPTG